MTSATPCDQEPAEVRCEWCGYIPADEEHACSRFGETPPSCASGGGEGIVTVGGYSVSPFSGVLVSDPQEAHDEPCPECQ